MAVQVVECEMRVVGVDLYLKYGLVKEPMDKHLEEEEEEEVVLQEEIDEQFDSMVDVVVQ